MERDWTWARRLGRIGGLLAGASIAALSTAAIAQATKPAGDPSSPGIANGPIGRPVGAMHFGIPAGELDAALIAYGERTGISLVYPSALASGRTTRGAAGFMTPAEALDQLLAGTGLAPRQTDYKTMTVVDAAYVQLGAARPEQAITLSTITVQGENLNSTMTPMAPYAGGQVATGGQLGMLGNRNIMSSPFSQTNFTNSTIQDQQAQTVQDVLANDPSVIVSGQNSTSTDVQFIRGFQEYGRDGTRNLNGLSGMAPLLYPSTDYIERVEVFRGPSARINGMSLASSGAIGGTINLVTKQAGNEPLTQVTARYMSDAQFGTHVDVGRRFGANKEFGIRVNGSFSGGDTALDTQRAQTGVVGVNLDYRGQRVRVSADFAHQARNLQPSWNALMIRPAFGVLTHVPRAPDSRTMLSPDWAEEKLTATLGMVRAEVDIVDNVTAYAAIGAQTYKQEIWGVGMPTLVNAAGRYSLAPSVELTQRDVLSMAAGIRATGTTGPVSHALSLNLSQALWTYRLSSWSGRATNIDTIYNPVFGPAALLTDPGSPRKSSERTVSSIGISDTLSFFDERIQLTAGIRYQMIDVKNYSTTTGLVTSEYDSQAWTPVVALVVKPWQNVSLYANYIEGLQPGSTVGTGYANTGETFSPYVSKQYEAGVKVDWGRVTTTLAVFQIAQPSTISVPAIGGGLPTLELNGEQRNRGVELNAYGEVVDGVRLLAGATFLDAVQTSTAGGAMDGKRGYAAPAVRLVLGGEWDMPFVPGLTLSGRYTFTSNQVVANQRPDLQIPSWKQFDVGARYTFASPWNGKPITVRANIDNLFDASYWKGSYAHGGLYRSEPRTYRLSTTFQF